MNRKIAVALSVLAVAVSLTACSGWNDANGRGDAPVGEVNHGTAEIMNYPDTYGNVAHKCDGHGHRVFTNTHGSDGETTSSFIVVIDDPTCPGGPAK
jgi:predicted small secreted protein